MPFTVTLPKLSPTMEEGTIAKWHKKEGDHVEAGELIIEVSTDKATVEYNAIDAGWLRKILIPEGKSAAVNQAIAIFTEEKTESIEGYKPTGIQPQAAPKPQPAPELVEVAAKPSYEPAAPLRGPSFTPEKPLKHYAYESPSEASDKRVFASPLAKKIAKEKGIDLTNIKGSGPRNRIVKADIEHAQPTGLAAFSFHDTPSIAPGTYEEEALTPIRKVIGQRLQEAKTYIPHFYVQMTVDAEPLVAIRDQLIHWDIKPTINDFMIKACAFALRQHPEINSGFNSVSQSIIRFKTIDISVAVSLASGLITPIIRHADYKNLGEISLEVKQLSKRAKEGKLEQQEYKGGSFTISNLGMYGVADFQAIINPPQAAILAVSAIQEVPVVRDSKIVVGRTMNLTLSVDHRVIDGVAAAVFLKTLKEYIEHPAIIIT